MVYSFHFYTNTYASIAGRLLGITVIGSIRSDAISEKKLNGYPNYILDKKQENSYISTKRYTSWKLTERASREKDSTFYQIKSLDKETLLGYNKLHLNFLLNKKKEPQERRLIIRITFIYKKYLQSKEKIRSHGYGTIYRQTKSNRWKATRRSNRYCWGWSIFALQ